MEPINKSARIEKRAEPGEGDMAKINAQALRELGAEEVFTFRIAAADTLVDRDYEHFSRECLEGMAKLYVGKPVLTDHSWSAGKQLARVYDAEVEETADGCRLVLCCYMPRTEATQATITAIEAGVLREASVGVAVQSARCGICGTDKAKRRCDHIPGRTYEGKTCVVELGDPSDAFEISLVAVPAQPKAGVIKAYGGENVVPNSDPPGEPGADSQDWRDEARLELEKHRFMEGSEV